MPILPFGKLLVFRSSNIGKKLEENREETDHKHLNVARIALLFFIFFLVACFYVANLPRARTGAVQILKITKVIQINSFGKSDQLVVLFAFFCYLSSLGSAAYCAYRARGSLLKVNNY